MTDNSFKPLNKITIGSPRAWHVGITDTMCKIIVKRKVTSVNEITSHIGTEIKPLSLDSSQVEILGNNFSGSENTYTDRFQQMLKKRHDEFNENICFIPGDWKVLDVKENYKDSSVGILTIRKDGELRLHFPEDAGRIDETGNAITPNYGTLTESSKRFIENARSAMKKVYGE
ncbi:hypothetical protein KKF84_04825 [Myxococcota bacterium]|nr:hypothetical protein [Myxococcota bacterium]